MSDFRRRRIGNGDGQLTTENRRNRSGQLMLAAARIKAEALSKGGDPSAGSQYAERATTPLSEQPPIGSGGELVPLERLGFAAPKVCNTIKNPSLVTADASVDRLHLLDRAGVLELALDTAQTINPQNSLEMTLAHQLAALHRSTMMMAEQLNNAVPYAGGNDGHNVRAARLAGAMARGSST